jgi:nitroreductase
MELRDVVARRRMVRRYTADPVAPEAVDRILDTARRGPSAGFAQGVDLVVVTEAATRGRIAELCGELEHVARGRQPWLSVAPVHVLPCVRAAAYRERYAEADKADSAGPDGWTVPFWWVDGGAALLLLLLAAVDEGLGAGVLDLADRGGVRDLLGIPDDVEPLALVTIGHPAADQPPSSGTRRPRRPFAEQVHRGRWRAAP